MALGLENLGLCARAICELSAAAAPATGKTPWHLFFVSMCVAMMSVIPLMILEG